MRLQKTPPPALPYAVTAYTPTYIDQLLKVLRLYFNRVSDVLNAITGVNGGQYIDCLRVCSSARPISPSSR